MKTYTQFKKEMLARKGVRAAYEALGPEFNIVASLIARRLKRGLTQKELAHRIGTKQASIARLESGTYNPSLAFLGKVSKALGARLEVVASE